MKNDELVDVIRIYFGEQVILKNQINFLNVSKFIQ